MKQFNVLVLSLVGYDPKHYVAAFGIIERDERPTGHGVEIHGVPCRITGYKDDVILVAAPPNGLVQQLIEDGWMRWCVVHATYKQDGEIVQEAVGFLDPDTINGCRIRVAGPPLAILHYDKDGHYAEVSMTADQKRLLRAADWLVHDTGESDAVLQAS